MAAFKLLAFVTTFFATQVYAGFDINCGKNHKAYVWNCQTLLDNWHLDDNTFYNPQKYACVWSGITKYGTIGCKLLENDSCTLVISYSVSTGGYTSAGFTGKELKGFVQDSINKCTSNNQLSSSLTGSAHLTKGGLCLCNHDTASSCG